MQKETIRFFIFGGLILFASILQSLGVAILGVTPNFVLTALVMVAVLLDDIWYSLFLVALSAWLLKFSPAAGQDLLLFSLVGAIVVGIERKLPWHGFVNALFLTVSATTILYALIDRTTINSILFVLELGYNILLTVVLYYGLVSFRLFRHR